MPQNEVSMSSSDMEKLQLAIYRAAGFLSTISDTRDSSKGLNCE